MSCSCVGPVLKSHSVMCSCENRSWTKLCNAEWNSHSVPVCQTAVAYLSFSPRKGDFIPLIKIASKFFLNSYFCKHCPYAILRILQNTCNCVTPPSTIFLSLKAGFPVLERVKPHLHIWYISVYRSVFHLPMHTNEDLGKAFPDANGELSGLTVLAGCKARAEKEEISLSPWESIAYWCKEPSNLSTLFKQFTRKEKKPQNPTNRGKKERKGFLLQIDRNGCIEFLLIKSLHSKELQGTKEALWLFRGREMRM